MSYAVSNVLDAITMSRVSRWWQRFIRHTPRLFPTVRVRATQYNVAALANVHRHWECIVCEGATSIRELCGSIRWVDGSVSKDLLTELTSAPNLKVLSLKNGLVTADVVSQALLSMQQLTELIVVFNPWMEDSQLMIPDLYQLNGLYLNCLPPASLSKHCPHLQSIDIDCDMFADYVDLSELQQLTDLRLLLYARYSLPSSLLRLVTYQSNLLVGDLPNLTEFKLYQLKKLETVDQLDAMCAIPSLKSVMIEGDLQPSTVSRLSELPLLTELCLSIIRVPITMQFESLRTLTICCYYGSDFLFECIAGLTTLRKLVIQHSNVCETVVFCVLMQLPELTHFQILDCKGVNVELLKLQFPNIAIN
jgi:hypothetical protein